MTTIKKKPFDLLKITSQLSLAKINDAIDYHQRQVDALRLMRQVVEIRDEADVEGESPDVSQLPPMVAPDVAGQKSLDADIEGILREWGDSLHEKAVAKLEKKLICRVLTQVGGNQSKAAAKLGISRSCLRSKISSLNIGISMAAAVDSEADE